MSTGSWELPEWSPCIIFADHSPCTEDLKDLPRGDFMSAWGGISSVQLGLPLFWTEGRRRGFGLADLNRLMACNTARLAGLDNRDRLS